MDKSTVKNAETRLQSGLLNLKQVMQATMSMRRRLTLKDKKTFKIAVIGAEGVGKSALTVRAITQKFIHNYAPNVEKQYSCSLTLGGEQIPMEILDSAALQTAANVGLEKKLEWADAFILMYSVTDEASLSALTPAKFLINRHAKRRRKSGGQTNNGDLLVALVGNKTDISHERCISEETGRTYAQENECSHFFEISVRETVGEVKRIFDQLYRIHRTRSPKLQRSVTRIRMNDTIPEDEDEYLHKYREYIDRKPRSKTLNFNASQPDLLPANESPVLYRKTQNHNGQQIIASSPGLTNTGSNNSPLRERKNGICQLHSPGTGLLLEENNNNSTPIAILDEV